MVTPNQRLQSRGRRILRKESEFLKSTAHAVVLNPADIYTQPPAMVVNLVNLWISTSYFTRKFKSAITFTQDFEGIRQVFFAGMR